MHHDQVRLQKFKNSLFQQLQDRYGIVHSRSTLYHLAGNGQCERMNITLLDMLRTLDNHSKADWKNHVNQLVHAYNCTVNETTDYSPVYCRFEDHPSCFPIGNDHERKDINSWIKGIQEAYQVAQKRTKECGAPAKKPHRLNLKTVGLKRGDHSFVRNIDE